MVPNRAGLTADNPSAGGEAGREKSLRRVLLPTPHGNQKTLERGQGASSVVAQLRATAV